VCCWCWPCAKEIDYRILGPLEVVAGECVLLLGGKLLRALLVTLLLHTREVRTVDQLIDDLWGDAAPPNARSSLHNVLSNLRRIIGRDQLETTYSGYALAIGEDELDAARFERLLGRARHERLGEKARLLEQAIGLWRGSPLVDVRYQEFAQSEIRRLEELHVCALEELLAAKVELGFSNSVVPELQRLVDGYPFRERPRMQLMVALHRSGRSVEAIATYVDWRRTLEADWGIEPSRAIHQLWEDIRLQSPGVEIVGQRQ
jgi:DNA-binding SARP family transcriptional activator